MRAVRALVCCLVVASGHGQTVARRGPASLDRAIIYQIWMRSFTPEGTLKAAAARLPHIAGLGAGIVYLSPINLMSRVGGFSNPYRIKDYYAIDPEYGSGEDLRAFAAAAHKLGLKVLMDIVYYHTAPDSVMMAAPELYMHDTNGRIVLGQWRLPRTDFANPKLREYLVKNLVYWARMGVDGFRCDVSGGIPVEFWESARAALDTVAPEMILLAESEKPEEMARAFDISYNFSHLTTLQRVFRDGEPAGAIRAQWEKTRERFPRGTRFLRASDNHDQARAIVLFGQKGAQAASVINATLDGIPFLYNGQEIGDTVATDHQSHYPLRWEIDMPEGQAGSGLARGQKLLAEWYRRLFHLRLEEPVLTSGEVVWVETSEPASVVGFLRKSGDRAMLVLVNASNRKVAGTVKLPCSSLEEVFRPSPERGQWQGGAKLESGVVGFEFGAFDYAVARVTQ